MMKLLIIQTIIMYAIGMFFLCAFEVTASELRLFRYVVSTYTTTNLYKAHPKIIKKRLSTRDKNAIILARGL